MIFWYFHIYSFNLKLNYKCESQYSGRPMANPVDVAGCHFTFDVELKD